MLSIPTYLAAACCLLVETELSLWQVVNISSVERLFSHVRITASSLTSGRHALLLLCQTRYKKLCGSFQRVMECIECNLHTQLAI